MSERDAAAQHVRWYAQIPRFECIEGCTDCCGPVPWSAYELEQAQLAQPPVARPDNVCEFSLAGRCQIHAVRPLMCRLFGAVEDLRCPHGRGPLELLPVDAGHDIVRRYKIANRME
ncbi:MAG: YkgJ family cysteine cluster protein [Proteobacteria bacterium]|nr:YkgJ family cysteine cluster protein [Burkholderiales bacterium]